jgi:transposase
VLAAAPTPAQGRSLSVAQLAELLGAAGRQRGAPARAVAVQQALGSPQLAAPEPVTAAYGQVVTATVGILLELNQQISALEEDLTKAFETHPDAEILRILPGLGVVLGTRVLAEFGDDPTRSHHLRHARPTRAPRRSPAPLAPARSCWPAWPATSAWRMPVTCGPSAP